MSRRTRPLIAPAFVFGLALVVGLGVLAPLGSADEHGIDAPPRLHKQPAQAVSDVVDRRIDEGLTAGEITPAPRSDDAEFLRRITLDLLGTVPTPTEVERFLDDKREDKRALKIDELLASEAYADNFGVVWFKILTGLSPAARNARSAGGGARYVSGTPGELFLEHLQDEIAANRPYDEMVHTLISASGRSDEEGSTGFVARWSENVNNLASATSKVFLGTRIQCAQCHDHIYEEDWTQKDFQAMTAFYAMMRAERAPEYREYRDLRRKIEELRIKGRGAAGGGPAMGDAMDGDSMGGDSMDGESMDGPAQPEARRRGRGYESTGNETIRELQEKMAALRGSQNTLIISDSTPSARQLAATKRRAEALARRNEGVIPERIRDRLNLMTITPKFWMGSERADIAGIPRRLMLARWITAPENKQFARTVVNRYWDLFLGTGFVNPIDDFNSFNEASDPELLELLADDLIRSGYDLQRLIRVITNTKAYQRTSRWEGEEPDPLYFAKAPVRPLTTEQVYHSILRATGAEDFINRQSRRNAQRMQQAIFSVFSFVFDDDEGKEAQVFEGSIPQGLFMMNGSMMQNAISARRGSMLDRLLREESTHKARIEALYMRAYGREPSTSEKNAALRFLNRAKDERAAYEDFLWALLNSAEFMTNH